MSEQTADATSDADRETELHTESHDPAVPEAYSAFMRAGLGRPRARPAARTRSRRTPRPAAQRLAEAFPGERLVLPAGTLQGAVLRHRLPVPPRHRAHLLLRQPDQRRRAGRSRTASRVLYARPRSERDTDEFFRDRQYGELWVGRRPSLQGDLRLARPRGAPHRRARRRPRRDAARPACTAASPRPSTRWSPPTRAATPTSPASSPRCG